MNQKSKSFKNPFYLFLLILSGEAIFILPFVLPRIFRPTVMDVFNLNNVELGLCFSAYGAVAMASYLFGGPIADRYPPRKLIAISLWATALGGFFMTSFPGLLGLQILYGFWGFTTIFLFWAPMIKATRVWGGKTSQGKAFGISDGGRGLVGAAIGSLGVLVFALFSPEEAINSPLESRQETFKYVIWLFSFFILLVGFLVWFFLKVEGKNEEEGSVKTISISQLKAVLKLPSVWLLMMIILCAYVGYKVTDIFSLYAQVVMGYDEIYSAQIGTFLLVMRPIVGISFGLIADKTNTTLWLWISFVLSALGSLLFASGIIGPNHVVLFFFSAIFLATGVFALRALYYAVMEKGQIPLMLTGTAVGVISLVGYTPDVFAGPAMGYFLDEFPGELGHQYVFGLLSAFSLLGGLAAYIFHKKYGGKEAKV
ncbi:MFS transporter [Algoriphagus sediminis]|uniref:MFS transporter n=1 Tax=Algoriphagus sediminis TaxID=3057113 RepID=A0ABT7YBA4_9BACT|nr:MFS transporter [Algoriphagus sediminis]MDN3203726.1 MFS transporter [Algoriphagus sediminis]